jgi:hypothetical protein
VWEKKRVYNILVETPRGRRILVVNERIIIKCTVKKEGENMWTEYIWFRIETNLSMLILLLVGWD